MSGQHHRLSFTRFTIRYSGRLANSLSDPSHRFYMDLSSIVFVGGVTFAMLLMIDNFNSATVGFVTLEFTKF